jgi:O-antigen/teichoic acid export membrane protein
MRPLITQASPGRSSVAVAASSLVIAALGGLLALLIAVILGEGVDTDAFLAAYSVYLVFTLFGATLRVALVPMMGAPDDEAALRRTAAEALGRLMSAGAVLALALVIAAPLLGSLVGTGSAGGPTGTAAVSLAILAGASYCQIAAAALSATLAAARRFAASAAMFTASSTMTVGLGSALMAAIGVEGAALGVLGGGIVLLASHRVYLHRFGVRAHPSLRAVTERETWRLARSAATGAAIPLTWQVMLTIALTAVAGPVGTVTAYSYAYFLAVLLSGVTSSTIAFVTMPDLVAALSARGTDAIRAYLEQTSPFSAFLYIPLAAATALFGRPVLDAVLEGSLSVATLDLLWSLLLVFLAMCAVWAVLAPLTALVLALALYRQLVVLGVATIALQIAVVVPLAHVDTEAAGMGHAAVASLLMLALAVLIFGRGAVKAVIAAVVRCAPAGAFALVLPAARLLGPDDPGPVACIALAAVGLAAYGVLAVVAWPSVGGRAVAVLRRGSGPG